MEDLIAGMITLGLVVLFIGAAFELFLVALVFYLSFKYLAKFLKLAYYSISNRIKRKSKKC